MTTLRIETPRVFLPLLNDEVRDLGAHGGRGSGKSHFFAEKLIERTILTPTRWCCGREVQKSIKESVKLLLEDKIQSMGIASYFQVMENEIRTPGDGKIIFTGMLNHTIDSIKSLEGFDGFWGAEAQSFSQRSIELVRPTIRKPLSQLWWDWNPESEDAPVDKMLRGPNKLTNAVVVESNWRDNPFFPEVLRLEMEADKLRDYDRYLHIWEGHYRRTLDGSIYADEVRLAYEQKRVCRVLPIPGRPVELFFDLGRDMTSIWFGQIQMGEYRLVRYYEKSGQKTAYFFDIIDKSGFQIGDIYLPHDAEQERMTGSIAAQFRAQYPGKVRVIPRMAKKKIGINAARTIFPNCYFDEENTKDGLKALARFRWAIDPDTGHPSRDEPLHDEYSHGADAFAQLALSLTEHKKATKADFSLDGRMAL